MVKNPPANAGRLESFCGWSCLSHLSGEDTTYQGCSARLPNTALRDGTVLAGPSPGWGAQGKDGHAGPCGKRRGEAEWTRGLVLGSSPRVRREARGFKDHQRQSLKSVQSLNQPGTHAGGKAGKTSFESLRNLGWCPPSPRSPWLPLLA